MPEEPQDPEHHSELVTALRSIDNRLDESNKRMERSEKYAADVERRTNDRLKDLHASIITKEHLRARRRQAIAIAAVITLVGLTFEHATVTKCFLSPSQAGWSKSTCATLFPGYTKAREVNEQRVSVFNSQLSRVSQLEARVKELEEKP